MQIISVYNRAIQSRVFLEELFFCRLVFLARRDEALRSICRICSVPFLSVLIPRMCIQRQVTVGDILNRVHDPRQRCGVVGLWIQFGWHFARSSRILTSRLFMVYMCAKKPYFCCNIRHISGIWKINMIKWYKIIKCMCTQSHYVIQRSKALLPDYKWPTFEDPAQPPPGSKRPLTSVHRNEFGMELLGLQWHRALGPGRATVLKGDKLGRKYKKRIKEALMILVYLN